MCHSSGSQQPHGRRRATGRSDDARKERRCCGKVGFGVPQQVRQERPWGQAPSRGPEAAYALIAANCKVPTGQPRVLLAISRASRRAVGFRKVCLCACRGRLLCWKREAETDGMRLMREMFGLVHVRQGCCKILAKWYVSRYVIALATRYTVPISPFEAMPLHRTLSDIFGAATLGCSPQNNIPWRMPTIPAYCTAFQS